MIESPPAAERMQVRDKDEALRALELLEQSQTRSYADRDLLCRILRHLLKKSLR